MGEGACQRFLLLLVLFGFGLLTPVLLSLQMIYDFFHQLPLEIDIEAQFTEKGEKLQFLPVFG